MGGHSPRKRWSAPSVEVSVGIAFLFITSFFAIEILHYFETGTWVLHGGLGAFERWPVHELLNLNIALHAIGMFAWMAIVVHQLYTRGSGAHKWVGRVGALGVIVALWFSLRPTFASEVPLLHGAFGLSLADLTLAFNNIGIAGELAIGVYKVRRGDVEGHRKHLMSSVLFTAGPGVYRINVEILTALFGLRGADAPVWETTWIHELSLAGALVFFLSLSLTRRFGGHVDVVRHPEGHDLLERGLAYFMVALVVMLAIVNALWVVDLLWMWPGPGTVLTRPDTHGTFVLHFLR
jgi:hypothetical protein